MEVEENVFSNRSILPKAEQKINEALESVMCDVIKIRLKRRDATRSKINISSTLK